MTFLFSEETLDKSDIDQVAWHSANRRKYENRVHFSHNCLR